MIRNVVGIIFLVMSGFFVYMIGLLSFFNIPEASLNKLILIAVLSLPMIIFHLVGLILYKASNWKVSTAMTFWCGSGFNLLAVISLLSIKASPEIVNVEYFNFFNDYLSGFIVMALFIGLGTVLYILDMQSNKINKISA